MSLMKMNLRLLHCDMLKYAADIAISVIRSHIGYILGVFALKMQKRLNYILIANQGVPAFQTNPGNRLKLRESRACHHVRHSSKHFINKGHDILLSPS
jgi:hypothetical protein